MYVVTSTSAARPVLNGRYELHRRIARGGMADVFLAKDQLLDRPVAVKVLFPQYAAEPTFVARFRREAQAAANLNHPNVVAVYDWGEHDGTYFIVMEYVEGQTLADVIAAQAPIPGERAAEIANEVAVALGFAHRNGTVHRDVKPGNIMITEAGQVKVADFGIARAFGGTDDELTQTGSVMGTATYFSPEQAQGKTVDPRSDLYSLGVVLFEMVVGEPPFLGNTPVAIAYKHVQEQAPRAISRNPNVSPAMDGLIARLLQKDPADRYPAAEELRAELRRFRNGEMAVPGANGTAVTAAVASPYAQNQFDASQAAPTAQAQAPAAYTPPADQAATQFASPPVANPGMAPAPAPAPQAPAAYDPTAAMPMGPNTAAMSVRETSNTSRALIDTSRAIPATAARSQSEQIEEYYEPPSRTGMFVIMLAILLVGMVGLIYYIAGQIQANNEEQDVNGDLELAEVFNVVGEDLNTAANRLRNEGFTVEIEPVEDAEGDPNRVIRQDPEAGAEVDPLETVVTLFYVEPEEIIQVPPLVGLALSDAQDVLRQSGLSAEITREFSDTVPVDQVIDTNPKPGDPVPAGFQVVLLISNGPSQVVVPPVANLSAADADSVLRGSGFTNIVQVGEGSASIPQGQVIRTEPAAETPYALDQEIRLIVSDGPQPVQMINLIGRAPEAAQQWLTENELVPQIEEVPLATGDPNIGLVFNHFPEPGQPAFQGTQVKLLIGVDSGTTTTDTTVPTTETTDTTTETTAPEETTSTETTVEPDDG